MARVAFHIHVDNLIADAVNIVTLGLFFNSSKIFYCYNCSIYIFFRPRVSLHDISNKASLILEDKSASTISATKPHLSSRTSWICSPRALDNPELDSLDEHD